jgi:hypothetical protein
MKAILIDPVTEGIFEVDHDPRKWGDLYGWLSDLARGVEVRSDTYVIINETNRAYVDEEGMLKNPKHFFQLRGARLPNGEIDHEPIAGRGLVLGYLEKDGARLNTTLTVEDVRALVTFGGVIFTGLDEFSGEVDHPKFGRIHVTEIKANFKRPPKE